MSDGPLSINIPTNEVKTAFPQIADNTWVKLRFVSVKSDKNEKGDFLKFEYDVVDPVTDDSGNTILPGSPGSKVFENIQLYAKPDAKDPKWFLKKLATRQDAILDTGDPENTKGKPVRPAFDNACIAQMTGQIFFALFKHRPDQNGVKRAEISEVAHPSAMKQ